MPQIRANGVMLEYEVEGPSTGAPFLFIAGFGQQLLSLPPEFREGLVREGFRVIRFDNRDMGLTQKWDGIIPDGRAVSAAVREGNKPDIPYFLADMAADAAGLLDALGINSAHVMGNSMGGMIAQLVALDYPSKARSLISVFSTTGDPSLPRSTPEAQEALTSRPKSGAREDVVAHGVASRKVFSSPVYPTDSERMAAMVGANFDRSYYPEGSLRQYAALVAGPPRTERLKSLKVPALVMHGGADPLIRPEAGRHTAASIPGAEYHEIEGWGHDMPVQLLPKLLDIIVGFMKKVEATRG